MREGEEKGGREKPREQLIQRAVLITSAFSYRTSVSGGHLHIALHPPSTPTPPQPSPHAQGEEESVPSAGFRA